MPKAQHDALKRKGLSDVAAYKIMNAQKTKRKAKAKPRRGGKGGR